MIELNDVKKHYGSGQSQVRALDGVDLRIDDGEFVAIVGPSGSGKSTMLQLMGALDAPTEGRVVIEGADTSRMSAGDLARLRQKTLGFVFQQFNLVPTLTARRNVEAPMVPLGVGRARRSEKAIELLETLGLGDRPGHLPVQLSGGEQQRVAIARALANDPKVILADEPTGNLDTATGVEVMRLMRGLSSRGHTIVLITHDMEVAGAAQRIVHLRDGRVEADGLRDLQTAEVSSI
jgi:ABC-type lipoprotein export system ATPase subunit